MVQDQSWVSEARTYKWRNNMNKLLGHFKSKLFSLATATKHLLHTNSRIHTIPHCVVLVLYSVQPWTEAEFMKV
jgi:hypothetical protein